MARTRLALLCCLCCLGSLGWLGWLGVAATALADEPQGSVITRTRAAFPQTEHWFRITATLRFDHHSDGRLVPVLSSLTHPRVRWADGAGLHVLARFAPTFDGAMRVESSGQPDAFVEVRPLRATAVRAVVEEGLVTYPGAYPDTDVIYKVTPTHVDEYLLLRGPRAPRTLRFAVSRGPSAARVRQAGDGIEVVDARGAAWLRATPPIATDASGRRVRGRLVAGPTTLEMRIDTTGLVYPILVDPDWMSTGDMSYGRFYHQANVLPDGRLVATGGCSASVCSGDLTLPACRDVVSAVEVLDLTSRTFSRVADDPVRRFLHAAERLPDGTFLLAGGCSTFDCATATDSVAIFDVASGVRSAGTLGEARGALASARLFDGRILLAGGCTASGCTTRTEIYDPGTGELVAAAPLGTARGRAVSVLLADGRVLVAGGCTAIACATVLSSAEVYDPVLDSWTSVGPMSVPRAGHAAARLDDGRVLVLGGCSGQSCTPVLASAERFDPATGRFSTASSLMQPRLGAGALKLPDGRVLVSQGCAAPGVCDLTNEAFDPTMGTFVAIQPAVTERGFHALVYSAPAGLVIANGGCQPRTCSWWNETYDVSSLVPPTDGGVPDGSVGDGGGIDGGGLDAAVRRYDAGRPRPRADGGPAPEQSGGCACNTVGASSATSRRSDAPGLVFAALLVALGWLSCGRRRRAIARATPLFR